MGAVTKVDFKNRLLEKTKLLGNNKRGGFKELCSDLINQHGIDKKGMQALMDGTFLSYNTIQRMAKLTETENGEPYRPNADTVERILRYFNAEVSFTEVKIKPVFRNTPKRDHD